MNRTHKLLAMTAPAAALGALLSLPSAAPASHSAAVAAESRPDAPTETYTSLPSPSRRSSLAPRSTAAIPQAAAPAPKLADVAAQASFPRYVPPVRSDTVGADLYVKNMDEIWSEWESANQSTRSAQRHLLVSLQLSVAVVLNQFGRYRQGQGPSHDSSGAPLRFVLNGYSYYFHDGEFPDYDRLLQARRSWTPESPGMPADLPLAVSARLAEAKAYLEPYS